MNKKQLISAIFIISLLAVTSAMASEVIKPLKEAEVKSVISRLNGQGIIFTFDKNVKKDKVSGLDKDGSFGMADTGEGWYLYKVDLNNDKKDEYVLAMFGGSGGFLDIEAIYQAKGGKLVDIFNRIKIPMGKLIKRVEKTKNKSEEEYTTFMNGSLTIEKDNNKIYFTLEKVTRRYDTANGGKFEDDFNPKQGYKFLWENGAIKLVDHYVGDKVYKS